MASAQEKKELSLGYLLWLLSLVGVCGVQRMYLGQFGYGLVLLFSFGLCGLGQLIDLFLLPDAVNEANRGLKFENPPRKYPSRQQIEQGPLSRSEESSEDIDDELEELLQYAQDSVKRSLKNN